MFVAGADGCRGGWVAFKVELPARATSVEVVDLPAWLRARPPDLTYLSIDIPIGLLVGPRACDIAARKRLGRPRGSSVFPAPCRAALQVKTYAEGSSVNRQKTGIGLSQQAWGIAPKIKQIDDAITPGCQQWVFEVHPEVCFWALAGRRAMRHKKKTNEGATRGSLHCAQSSRRLNGTSQADRLWSPGTICWMPQWQLGLRCGCSTGNENASARRSEMRRVWLWRSTISYGQQTKSG